MDIRQAAIPNVSGSLVFGSQPEEQEKIYDFIEKKTELFLVRYMEGTTLITADTVLEQLIEIYEESFADLMSISILGLTAKDYLDCIINSTRQQGKDLSTICRSNVIYRVLLVFDVMYGQAEGGQWADSYQEQDENTKSRYRLMSSMYKVRKLIKEGWNGKSTILRYRDNCFHSLLSKTIYKNALHYLRQCKECFDKDEDANRKRTRKNMSQFYEYERAESNSIEVQLKNMENFIHSYKQNLLQDLKADMQ